MRPDLSFLGKAGFHKDTSPAPSSPTVVAVRSRTGRQSSDRPRRPEPRQVAQVRPSQAAPGPRANADAPCLSPRKQVLAGAQAAVLAESEESLQELVMRDAEALADYRLRQNADDNGTRGERQMGKERVGRAWRPSGWTRAWRAGGPGPRFPPHRGGWHEGPDHRTWGARGPGISSGLGLPGAGEGAGKGAPTIPRARGLQEDKRENTWVCALEAQLV